MSMAAAQEGILEICNIFCLVGLSGVYTAIESYSPKVGEARMQNETSLEEGVEASAHFASLKSTSPKFSPFWEWKKRCSKLYVN